MTTRQFADECHRLLLSNYSTVILAKLERQVLHNMCAWPAICNRTVTLLPLDRQLHHNNDG